VVLAVLAAACGSSPSSSTGPAVTSHTTTTPANPAANLSVESPPAVPVTLSESGSATMYPLWNLWVPKYHTQYPTVSITTASTDSATGVGEALAGQIDIGASDAALTKVQREASPDGLSIPLAESSVVVTYHLAGVRAHLALSGTVLSAIYRGTITSWNAGPIAALNPGTKLPATRIVTVHRSDPSGDTLLFTSYLSRTDGRWRATVGAGTSVSWPNAPGALVEQGNGGTLAACEREGGCLAYLGSAYQARASAAGLGVAALRNGAGTFVVPTPSSVQATAAAAAQSTPPDGDVSLVDSAAAGAYPVVGYGYAIALRHQPSATTAQAVRSVLDWTVDPNAGGSTALLSSVGFEPLPAAVAARSAAQIRKIH